MEEHRVQARDTQDDHLQQWSSVRQPRFPLFLIEPQHQEQILLPRASPRQWANRSDESDIVEDHQSSIRGGKRSMARWMAKFLIGLSNYSQNPTMRDAFQPHIRHRSNNPRRDWSHQLKKKVFQRRWQWRPIEVLPGRSYGPNFPENSQISIEDDQILQQEGKT